MKKGVIIFDIDGTLADNTHRLHYLEGVRKDWDEFYSCVEMDYPIREMISLCNLLIQNTYDSELRLGNDSDFCDVKVVFVTGRPERTREKTEWWLLNYVFPKDGKYDDFVEVDPKIDLKLYMRKDGDHRDDWVVKEDILNEIQADGTEVLMAIDDRKQVVDMWRRNGVRCLQCAEGDF